MRYTISFDTLLYKFSDDYIFKTSMAQQISLRALDEEFEFDSW